jgi:hypothetical protein
MAELKALCMKCKNVEGEDQMQTMTDITIQEKGGRYSARGVCGNGDCGTGMFKFLSKDDAEKLETEGHTIEHVEAEEKKAA